jgi:hypothetical protein
MKKFLSLVLSATFLSSTAAFSMKKEDVAENFPPTKMVSKVSLSSVKENKNEILMGEYHDYLLDEQAWYEDYYKHSCNLEEEFYNDEKTKGAEQALKIVLKKLGMSQEGVIEQEDVISFLANQTMASGQELNYVRGRIISFKNILKENIKFKEKALKIFDSLFLEHNAALVTRLLSRRDRKGQVKKIIDTNSLSLVKTNTANKKLFNKDFTYNPEIYQMRLYFLKAFYTLVKTKITDKWTLASIQMNKNLYDILEGKVEGFGHIDQGVETQPTDDDVDKALTYWKNEEHFQKNNKKALKNNNNKKALKNNKSKRVETPHCSSILVYFHRSSQSNGETLIFAKDQQRKLKIDWDRVTLTNIDNVLPQVKHFINISKESFEKNKNYLETKRKKLLKPSKELIITKENINIHKEEQKVTEEKPTAIKEEQKVINEKPITIKKEQKIIEEGAEAKEKNIEMIRKQLTLLDIPPKKEKNREERRKEWERKVEKETKRQKEKERSKNRRNSEEEESSTESTNSTSSSASTSPFASPRSLLNKKNLKTLYQIYKSVPAKEIQWKKFVKVWKKLRLHIDNIKDEPIPVTGSIWKFHGGPESSFKFNVHEPHEPHGDTIGPKTIIRIGEQFKNKFGWTSEKLEKHGIQLNQGQEIDLEEKIDSFHIAFNSENWTEVNILFDVISKEHKNHLENNRNLFNELFEKNEEANIRKVREDKNVENIEEDGKEDKGDDD